MPTRDESLKASRRAAVACPFGKAVVHVEYPGRVEYVTCRLECLRDLRWCPEVEERRKPEPHVSSFISDERAAKIAAYFAGQDSLGLVQSAIEESQVIQSRAEPDVVLMENGGPLHRRPMQLLAHDAVADLRAHGIGGDMISNRPAMAACFVPGLEVRIVRAQEELLEFIHVSVSSTGCDLFSMRVRTRNGECQMTDAEPGVALSCLLRLGIAAVRTNDRFGPLHLQDPWCDRTAG